MLGCVWAVCVGRFGLCVGCVWALCAGRVAAELGCVWAVFAGRVGLCVGFVCRPSWAVCVCGGLVRCTIVTDCTLLRRSLLFGLTLGKGIWLSTAQWSLYVSHSGHYMYRQFNIQQFHVLPTQCIYVFCVDLRTNSHYFPIQH